jgi:hypothetical protein
MCLCMLMYSFWHESRCESLLAYPVRCSLLLPADFAESKQSMQAQVAQGRRRCRETGSCSALVEHMCRRILADAACRQAQVKQSRLPGYHQSKISLQSTCHLASSPAHTALLRRGSRPMRTQSCKATCACNTLSSICLLRDKHRMVPSANINRGAQELSQKSCCMGIHDVTRRDPRRLQIGVRG